MVDVFTGVVNNIIDTSHCKIAVDAAGAHNTNHYIGNVAVIVRRAKGLGLLKARTLNNMIDAFNSKHVTATVVGMNGNTPIVDIALDGGKINSPLPPQTNNGGVAGGYDAPPRKQS